ncbi:MAG: family acetyltransferase [Tardiphaga sp.]|nr:family acetyltransferase [Tardiphaga sp.]
MLVSADAPSLSRRAIVRLRSGLLLTIRAVATRDAAALQNYVRALSAASRYARMLGATSELPPSELQAILHPIDADHVALVATLMIDGVERIVGEARLFHDPETERVELALSVDDRWQKQGLGLALFDDLQRRAAEIGPVDLFGDTLRTNAAMIGLARRSGFALLATPGDWRLTRFQKHIDRSGILPSRLPISADPIGRLAL